jgi:hypothetical protein
MQHVWVFQLDKSPSQAAKERIENQLAKYMVQWKSHGSPVPGEAEIRYDRFVLVQAEPGHASGCSIDSMNRGVSDILLAEGIEVLGPEHIFYKGNDGSINTIDFRDVKTAILDGSLNAETIIFDSSMGQSTDLRRWEVQLQDSWLGRFLPQNA